MLKSSSFIGGTSLLWNWLIYLCHREQVILTFFAEGGEVSSAEKVDCLVVEDYINRRNLNYWQCRLRYKTYISRSYTPVRFVIWNEVELLRFLVLKPEYLKKVLVWFGGYPDLIPTLYLSSLLYFTVCILFGRKYQQKNSIILTFIPLSRVLNVSDRQLTTFQSAERLRILFLKSTSFINF